MKSFFTWKNLCQTSFQIVELQYQYYNTKFILHELKVRICTPIERAQFSSHKQCKIIKLASPILSIHFSRTTLELIRSLNENANGTA